jgi:hypothetical protein
MRRGVEKFGEIPYCDSRCHVGCYMEPSTLISHPEEAVLWFKEFFLPPPKKLPPLRKPAPQEKRVLPPPFCTLRSLPSLPVEEVRRLRREGRLENDFTSLLRVKGAEATAPAA